MNIIEKTPLLVSGTKSGNQKFWLGFVGEENGNFYTFTEYWQGDGFDLETRSWSKESKHQTSEPRLIEGKNLGRSNETSPKDQAISELKSTFQHYKDKGYQEISDWITSSKSDSKITILDPMLAQDYNKISSKRKANLVFPAAAQPKLDGARCTYNMNTGFFSRGMKEFIKECTAHLRFPTGRFIFDGELMLPYPATFQESMQVLKKYRDKETNQRLEYHIFDVFDPVNPNAPFSRRMETILNVVGKISHPNPNVKIVPTYLIKTENDLFRMHARFIAEGHEGTMYRDLDAPYLVGHRSEYLLKYKDMIEEEFEVTNVIEGQAKEKGCAIFVCKTKEGRLFNARPIGTSEERRSMYLNKTNLIGKQLTVKFQNYSDENLPRFPVAKAVREDWDK